MSLINSEQQTSELGKVTRQAGGDKRKDRRKKKRKKENKENVGGKDLGNKLEGKDVKGGRETKGCKDV